MAAEAEAVAVEAFAGVVAGSCGSVGCCSVCGLFAGSGVELELVVEATVV